MHARPATTTAIAGVIGLVGLAALVATLDDGNRLLELGGLPLVSVLTAAVIVAAITPGPVRGLLSWSPLVGLGRISYGVYVYHWPLFLLLTTQRTGLRGAALVGERLGATLVVALGSYVLIEQPVRRGQRITTTTARRVLPIAFASVALLALTVGVSTHPAIDFNAALRAQAAAAEAATTTTTAAVTPRATTDATTAAITAPAAAAAPARIAMFGDSTALMAGIGLAHWGADTGRLQIVAGVTPLGCGIGRGGERRDRGVAREIPANCEDWPTAWSDDLAGKGAATAVILDGEWDVADRLLPGDTVWRHIGDPVYDTYLRKELLAAVDLLRGQRLRVVVLTCPRLDVGQGDPDPPTTPYPESDPARVAALNQMWRDVAAARPGVQIVDLAGHLASLPGGEMDPALRPDGVHFTEASGRQVADWLGPAIVAAATTNTRTITR